MENKTSNSSMFWAIIISSIGLVFLMRNFGLLHFKTPTDIISWRLIPAIVGINAFFKGKNIQGIIGVGLALIFFMPEFLTDAQADTFYKLWPLLLIAGGGLVFVKKYIPSFEKALDREHSTTGSFDSINESSFMGGSSTKITTKNFVGGKITSVMGGVELDFRQAELGPNATISAFTLMGGVEMIIPKEWNVKLDVFPLMGGVDDEIKKYPSEVVDENKKLFITGNVIMGGIGIKRV